MKTIQNDDEGDDNHYEDASYENHEPTIWQLDWKLKS